MNINIWGLTKQTVEEWLEDKAPRLGAALAFYAIFAIAPMFVVAIAIAGSLYGEEAARGQLFYTLSQWTGSAAADTIQNLITAASRAGNTGVFATSVSFIILLVAGSGLFAELQDALNTIWEVAPRQGLSWMDFFRARFLQFLLVLLTGFFLLASMLLSAGLSAFLAFVGTRIPFASWVPAVVDFVLPIVILTFLIALIFKYLPDVLFAWRDVWIGAALTAVLLTIGKYLIALYLAHSTVGSAYGAAGSLAILLLWIYYSAQIVFLGAEFTQVYAKCCGGGMRPKYNAIPITEEARAQQGIPHKQTAKPA